MNHSGGNTSHDNSRQRLGALVARLLRGAWREPEVSSQQSSEVSGQQSEVRLAAAFSEAELTEITPLLCRSGAGALAWRQLRHTTLADCPAALELREVYRRQRLSALLHERELAGVVTLLANEGIEAVLVKGWAIARRYPDSALRPYGDIDLCVRPDQFARAVRLFERVASVAGPFVDLHCGFARIGQTKTVPSPKTSQNRLRERVVQSQSVLRRLWPLDFGLGTNEKDDWDELFERSHVVQCPNILSAPGAVATGCLQASVADSLNTRSLPLPVLTSKRSLPLLTEVRVLADEDHLRLLCLHLLRSGAHRPPWLCDVALLVEQLQSQTANVLSEPGAVATGFRRTNCVTGDYKNPVATAPGSDSAYPVATAPSTYPVATAPGSDNIFDVGRFNWDTCLGRNPVHANWIGVAVQLAHELLGADIRATPFTDRPLPRWLAPAVLEQWGGKRSGRSAVGSGQKAQGRKQQASKRVQSPGSNVPSQLEAGSADIRCAFDRAALADSSRGLSAPRDTPGSSGNNLPDPEEVKHKPLAALRGLYARWDNPIRATAAVGGRFDERSRLPYRLLESAMRLPELVTGGQWSVVGGQWSVVGGQWPVVSGRWSVASVPGASADYADYAETPRSD